MLAGSATCSWTPNCAAIPTTEWRRSAFLGDFYREGKLNPRPRVRALRETGGALLAGLSDRVRRIWPELTAALTGDVPCRRTTAGTAAKLAGESEEALESDAEA